MNARMILACFALAAPGCLGCGPAHEAPGADDAAISAGDAAAEGEAGPSATYTAFAAAYCGWLFRCFPTIPSPGGYASEAACEQGVAGAAAQAMPECDPACAPALSAGTCSDLLWQYPATCYAPSDAGAHVGGCCATPGTACR